MDFSKLFNGISKDMGSNLTVKIGHPPVLKSKDCFCMWSDLLGFAKIFVGANWNLDKH